MGGKFSKTNIPDTQGNITEEKTSNYPQGSQSAPLKETKQLGEQGGNLAGNNKIEIPAQGSHIITQGTSEQTYPNLTNEDFVNSSKDKIERNYPTEAEKNVVHTSRNEF